MSLHDQFMAGWVPDTLEMEGDWVVRGLLGPLPLRFLGHKKQFHAAGDGTFTGNNQFLGFFKTGYFEASLGVSQVQPDLPVINISYNVPRNPWIMRGLTDEVRFVAEDKLLGRGIFRLGAKSGRKGRNIFWFTVSRG